VTGGGWQLIAGRLRGKSNEYGAIQIDRVDGVAPCHQVASADALSKDSVRPVIMTGEIRKRIAHLRPSLILVPQYPAGQFRGETSTIAHDIEA
jgi:hypothetical protein